MQHVSSDLLYRVIKIKISSKRNMFHLDQKALTKNQQAK